MKLLPDVNITFPAPNEQSGIMCPGMQSSLGITWFREEFEVDPEQEEESEESVEAQDNDDQMSDEDNNGHLVSGDEDEGSFDSLNDTSEETEEDELLGLQFADDLPEPTQVFGTVVNHIYPDVPDRKRGLELFRTWIKRYRLNLLKKPYKKIEKLTWNARRIVNQTDKRAEKEAEIVEKLGPEESEESS